MNKLNVVLLSCAFILASIFPTQAFPIQGMTSDTSMVISDVQQIRDRPNRRPPHSHRPPPRPRPGYHNGYHGSKYYRKGYRRYNDGWWYPMAAFGAGVIIGGAIASQPAPVYGSVNTRHVQWCTNRYRTYRAYDNTYAPRVGVRAQCVSPYF
jgi:hypothetical protein